MALYGFTKIDDMAFRRKELASKLNDLNDSLIYHYVKYCAMPNHIDRSHWAEVIQNYITTYCGNKLRENNKVPEKKFYYDNLFSYICDAKEDIATYFQKMCKDYHLNLNDFSEEYKNKVGFSYFVFADLCSNQLSKNISKPDMKQKVKEFLDISIIK